MSGAAKEADHLVRVAEAIDGHTFGVDDEHPMCYCGLEFTSWERR